MNCKLNCSITSTMIGNSQSEMQRCYVKTQISSFEDWLVKYETKGCPYRLKRCPAVTDWWDYDNYDNFVEVPYDSDDDDCNDNYFTKLDAFFDLLNEGII
jgi:hypothetical protein